MFAWLPLALLALAAGSDDPLRVGASPAFASCAESASRAFGAARTLVMDHGAAGGAADVFVGADAEVTRLIESGAAVEGSDVALGQTAWILVGADSLERLDAAASVVVLGGAAGYEARRRLEARLGSRFEASVDQERLRRAGVRVVPASLGDAAVGQRLDWPALRVRGVVLAASARQGEARGYLERLAAGSGTDAFPTCLDPVR